MPAQNPCSSGRLESITSQTVATRNDGNENRIGLYIEKDPVSSNHGQADPSSNDPNISAQPSAPTIDTATRARRTREIFESVMRRNHSLMNATVILETKNLELFSSHKHFYRKQHPSPNIHLQCQVVVVSRGHH